jgi:hypothetical protein
MEDGMAVRPGDFVEYDRRGPERMGIVMYDCTEESGERYKSFAVLTSKGVETCWAHLLQRVEGYYLKGATLEIVPIK